MFNKKYTYESQHPQHQNRSRIANHCCKNTRTRNEPKIFLKISENLRDTVFGLADGCEIRMDEFLFVDISQVGWQRWLPWQKVFANIYRKNI